MTGSSPQPDADGPALSSGDALFLDFDGTLAEIGPDPDAIRLDPATAEVLAALAARLGGAVALLSGRGLADLASRTPAGLWRIGGHGLQVAAPGTIRIDPPPPPDPAALAALDPLSMLPCVRVEVKGPILAIHYRAAPESARSCLELARRAAAAGRGLVVQCGKMVVEVKPETAHKGVALRRLAATVPFAGRRPVMVGDDTTDEDAILAAQDLGGLGIRVGPGPSAARARLATPAAVRGWLARQAAA